VRKGKSGNSRLWRLIIKEDVAPKFISLPQVCLGAYQDCYFRNKYHSQI